MRTRPPSRLCRLRRTAVCGDGRKGRAPVKTRNGRDARCPLCGGHDGIWPPEFERILNGESASMLAQDAQAGKLESCLDSATLSPHSTGQVNHFDICSPEINGIIPS